MARAVIVVTFVLLMYAETVLGVTTFTSASQFIQRQEADRQKKLQRQAITDAGRGNICVTCHNQLDW